MSIETLLKTMGENPGASFWLSLVLIVVVGIAAECLTEIAKIIRGK